MPNTRVMSRRGTLVGAALILGTIGWAGSDRSLAPSAAPAEAAPARDPWLRPFSSTSIWNMPIGSGAQYRDAQLPYSENQALETSYLMKTRSSDPLRPVMTVGNWRDRCSGTRSQGTEIHLPDGWRPKPVTENATPNNPGVFLQPDGRTLVNVGSMARCSDTGPLHANRPGDAKHITDLYGDGIAGAHGASRLSQLGGAIRPGELSGSDPIRHALDLLIWSEYLYWGGDKESSYRWPASSSDRYAGPDRYRGSNPDLRMGSLLAIPPGATPQGLGISTEVGRKLFDALQNYGAYVTDDSAWRASYIGVDSNAIGTFPWGPGEQKDMARMVAELAVVTNNGPNSIGGGGVPRRPLLPELDGTFTRGSDVSFPGDSGPPGPPPEPSVPVSDLNSATRVAPPPIVPTESPGSGALILSDSFDASSPTSLADRRNPRWTLFGGVIDADAGVARVRSARGSTVAVVDAGTADVVISSSITMSPGRSATGVALRAADRDNAITVSMVIRDGQPRLSLHAVESGKYALLADRTGVGLGAGATHALRVTAVGRDITVDLDGVRVLRHRLSNDRQERFADNTRHGLRMMRSSVADDGRSVWNDFAVSRP